MSKDKFSKDQKVQIKNDLEALLHNFSGTNEEDSVIDQQLAVIQQAPPIDFEEMNANFKKKANNLTNSLLKFYVDLGIIDRVEYFKHKKEIDNTNLENIFFQIKSIRMAIERIMEEINQGNTHPRLFEVFGQLHDKLGSVIKMQANYVLFLEDAYRKAKSEVTQMEGEPQQVGQRMKGDYYVTAGTKNLMKEIETEVKPVDKTDTRYLTHPVEKDNVLVQKGLGHLIEKKEEIEEISKDDLGDMI